MKPIKYNDTGNYEYIEALGIEGVFTSLRIERDTLPEGFYKYSFREGEEEMICQVSNEVLVNHAGDFITKEPLPLDESGARSLGPDDWGFTRRDFDFENFFGTKLSIDCQISNAEAKKAAQMGEGREEMAHGKASPRINDSFSL